MTDVLVYFPDFIKDLPPSVCFWVEDGVLRQYAPNPDAYSVDRAWREIRRKKPSAPWIGLFHYLGEKNPNPGCWDVFEGVEGDIREFLDEMRSPWK